MSPYLAIIKDSFREALASRVLWALIAIITLLLLALAPLYWESSIAPDITSGEIRNPRNIADSLAAGADEDATALQKHLWGYLSKQTKDWITEPEEDEKSDKDEPTGEANRGRPGRGGPGRGGPPNNVIREHIARDLNDAIGKDDFYVPALWEETKLSKRAQDLLDAGVTGEKQKFFNRLALESALPGLLRPCPDEAVTFKYAIWDLGFPSVRRQDGVESIDGLVVPLMSIFVGFFGVFSGVLVTAPIIPNMLNSGSLYVLLSKPIARPLLFLAKFLGGCSYVFINATYLIVGIWLLLGLRFGIWKPQILWSIPLFSFAFAIFYSVSALAGLVWRSSIMSIVLTILFWMMCFAVGNSKAFIELLVMLPTEINNISTVGDQLLVRRFNGSLELLDNDKNAFQQVLASSNRRGPGPPEVLMGARAKVEGLVFDEVKGELVVMEREWSQPQIIVGSKDSGFRRDRTIKPPRNARGLFLCEQQPIVVADGGVYPLVTESEESTKREGTSIFGLFTIPPPPTKEKPIEKFSADLGRLPKNAKVDYDPSTRSIYVLGDGKLRRWDVTDGMFDESKSTNVDFSGITHLITRNERVVVAHRVRNESEESNEVETVQRLSVFDAELNKQSSVDLDDDSKIRVVKLSDDGSRLACLRQDQSLQVFRFGDDNAEPKVAFHRKDITSVGFAGDQLLTTNNTDQVSKFGLADFSLEQKVQPELSFMKRLYQRFVNPIYLIFPKPGELDKTMRYLITGEESISLEQLGPGKTVKLNPWQPVRSNLMFIGVVLLLGCWYVYRQDF